MGAGHGRLTHNPRVHHVGQVHCGRCWGARAADAFTSPRFSFAAHPSESGAILAAAADTTTLTAPPCNLALDNSTPEFPAPTPAVANAPKSQRINEISREKIVSDLLEKKIKPTSDNFLASLHLELCQDFGMNPVDSLFSDQLFKKCENFSKEAAKLWRKRRGKEETIFAYNRGVCTNKYIFILEI